MIANAEFYVSAIHPEIPGTHATPVWEHDCSGCVFLGQHMVKEYVQSETSIEDGEWVTHDIYFCLQGGEQPTVVERFGNEGWEYQSGWIGTIPDATRQWAIYHAIRDHFKIVKRDTDAR